MTKTIMTRTPVTITGMGDIDSDDDDGNDTVIDNNKNNDDEGEYYFDENTIYCY